MGGSLLSVGKGPPSGGGSRPSAATPGSRTPTNGVASPNPTLLTCKVGTTRVSICSLGGRDESRQRRAQQDMLDARPTLRTLTTVRACSVGREPPTSGVSGRSH